MDGYIKIVLLDETGKITNSSLCTGKGRLLFNEKEQKKTPELIHKMLQLIKSNSQQNL